MILKSEELWNATVMASSIPLSQTDFIDCAGIAWPPSSFPIIPAREGNSSLFFPKDGDGFRAGKIEWEALCISVFVSKNNLFSKNQVLAIELGASAEPWALTFVKHVLASTNNYVNTIAIEAGNVKKITRLFWSRNDLKFKKITGLSRFTFKGERFKSVFLRGVATNKSGKMFFPKVDISKDNGAAGAEELSQLDRRGKIRINRVRAIDTLNLIQAQVEVSLLHMDVQGAEVGIMQDPRFGAAIQKVQVLLIGTHSVLADELAEDLDGKHGLTLIAGSRMKTGGSNGEWPVDGEFLFINEEVKKILIESGILQLEH
jgi:hypothetical protein